jgi:hypothetical protein
MLWGMIHVYPSAVEQGLAVLAVPPPGLTFVAAAAVFVVVAVVV